MISHFYVKHQKKLKLIYHIGDVPEDAVAWRLRITHSFGNQVMEQELLFMRVKGAMFEQEAMFLYDADIELKGVI